MAKRLNIAAVGEICLDRYLPEGDEHLGGISVNFARAAARSGADAAIFAAIGDDPSGRVLAEMLAHSGLDLRGVRTLAGPSTLQRIELRGDGERILSGFTAGVAESYFPTADELIGLARFDALAVPWAPETERLARSLVDAFSRSSARPLLACDVSRDSAPGALEAWLAPALDLFELVFVGGSRDDLPALERRAREFGGRIVLTCGADGAWALDREGAVHQPTLATKIVDTTGCGDAFQGGFVTAIAGGAEIHDALLVGAERAAEAASRRGA